MACPASAARRWLIQTAPSRVARRIAPSRVARISPGRPTPPAGSCQPPKRRQGRPATSSTTPGKPSAAWIFARTVSVSSACQSIARSGCRISGRGLPATFGSSGSSGRGENAGSVARSTAASTQRVAASVTSRRYRLLLAASRMAKPSLAQVSPASISASACSSVTPHSRARSRMAQSSADGPRSPRMPGCTTRQGTRRQTSSGIARLRNGATIRSGWNRSAASRVTWSLMSNSTDSS